MNDLDYTGYGPTSAGRAPSAAELRRAAYNRYHTSRAIQAMQYQDPETAAAAERMVQLAMGSDKSPAAVRRTLYGTSAGQATLDAAFAARSAGYLGYGDPREYSANIMQLVSGGFKQSIMAGALDDNAGRIEGFSQQVSGNGMIAERAAITMQKKMLDNLYGEGQSADPRRLNGYDMTEASQVAARIVGKRGMGNLMTYQRNADIETRIAAAKQSEVDPSVRAGLEGLTDDQKDKLANAERKSPDEFYKAVDEVAATMADPKAAEALKNIAKSKGAMAFNEKGLKVVTDAVEEVTKGMAALNDIYGSLSSDTAHAMLEQIHGGRITNKQQARAAARTVDDMRNAAEYAGMDPKQLMALFAEKQASFADSIGDELGMDERSESKREALGSKLSAATTSKAVIASKNIAQASAVFGLEGDGPTAREIMADKVKMQTKANKIYGGFVYSQGDMNALNEDQREAMRKKAVEFEAASEAGDTESMRRINAEMEKVVSPTGDFKTITTSGIGLADMLSAQAKAEAKITKMSRDDLATNYGLMNNLDAVAGTGDTADTIQKIGGVENLRKLAAVENIKPTKERIAEVGLDAAEKEAAVERTAQTTKILANSGATEAERVKALNTLYNSDGTMKDEVKNYAEASSVKGSEKLVQLAKIEKIKPTKERIEQVGITQAEQEAAAERSKQKKAVLDSLGSTEEERVQAEKTFYNSDGTMKDKFKDYVELSTSGGTNLDNEQKRKFNQFVLNDLGFVGLSRLEEINQIKATPDSINRLGKEGAEKEAAELRRIEIDKTFNKAEATDEERAQAMKILYNADGTLKEGVKNYASVLRDTDRTGAVDNTFDKNDRAEISLRNLEKNDKRQRMLDKDNKISVRGIAKAMLSGDIKSPLENADTAAAALDTLKAAGIPLTYEEEEEYVKDDGTTGTRKVTKDLTEKYASGFNLAKLDNEALDKIDKVAGKEVNLVDRVNKKLGTNMTREEFIEKSKKDKKIQDAAYTELSEAGSEIGFSASGARDNFSVVHGDVKTKGEQLVGKRFDKLKTLEAVSGFVSDDEMKKLTTEVLQGGEANLGDMIEADDYDANSLLEVSHDRVKTKDGKYGARLENSGKFQAITDIANKGDKHQIADLAGMLGEKGLAEFDKQIAAMESALASGDVTGAKMVDADGNERTLDEKTINEFKNAVNALRATAEESSGAQKIGVMTVTKLEVTGDFNAEKK